MYLFFKYLKNYSVRIETINFELSANQLIIFIVIKFDEFSKSWWVIICLRFCCAKTPQNHQRSGHTIPRQHRLWRTVIQQIINRRFSVDRFSWAWFTRKNDRLVIIFPEIKNSHYPTYSILFMFRQILAFPMSIFNMMYILL